MELEKLKRVVLENSVNVQKRPVEVLYKKATLKSFAIFIGKHMCWSFFLIKLPNTQKQSFSDVLQHARFFICNFIFGVNVRFA